MAQNGIANLHHHLQGDAIAKMLSSVGPVVKCVLLRATPLTDSTDATSSDAVNHSSNGSDNNENNDGAKQERVLVDLIEEIEVDTTPSKSMASEILGGSITFLGQYDEEGIVLMVRKLDEDIEDILCNSDDPEQLDSETLTEYLQEHTLKDLREKCLERGIDVEGVIEKGEVIRALRDSIQESFDQLPPPNLHQLQPPLDRFAVRGDILIMKVAETNESLDNTDGEAADVVVPTNDEFFLDYTKDEYIAFASRTDIVSTFGEDEETDEEVAHGGNDNEDDDEEEQVEEDDDDEEGDEAYTPLDAGEDVVLDEDKGAMLNFIMAEVLRKFREENGRGPDTRELLELRAGIAERLGVEVASVDMHDTDWDQKANRKKKAAVESTDDEKPVKSILNRKRSASDEEPDDDDNDEPESKKVKFAEGFEPAEPKEESV
jgi:hypothetical protein